MLYERRELEELVAREVRAPRIIWRVSEMSWKSWQYRGEVRGKACKALVVPMQVAGNDAPTFHEKSPFWI